MITLIDLQLNTANMLTNFLSRELYRKYGNTTYETKLIYNPILQLTDQIKSVVLNELLKRYDVRYRGTWAKKVSELIDENELEWD